MTHHDPPWFMLQLPNPRKPQNLVVASWRSPQSRRLFTIITLHKNDIIQPTKQPDKGKQCFSTVCLLRSLLSYPIPWGVIERRCSFQPMTCSSIAGSITVETFQRWFQSKVANSQKHATHVEAFSRHLLECRIHTSQTAAMISTTNCVDLKRGRQCKNCKSRHKVKNTRWREWRVYIRYNV